MRIEKFLYVKLYHFSQFKRRRREAKTTSERGLQTTLNKRGFGNTTQVLPHLKEDGEFGPKTLAHLDEELLRAGPTPVLRET